MSDEHGTMQEPTPAPEAPPVAMDAPAAPSNPMDHVHGALTAMLGMFEQLYQILPAAAGLKYNLGAAHHHLDKLTEAMK